MSAVTHKRNRRTGGLYDFMFEEYTRDIIGVGWSYDASKCETRKYIIIYWSCW